MLEALRRELKTSLVGSTWVKRRKFLCRPASGAYSKGHGHILRQTLSGGVRAAKKREKREAR